MLRSCDMFVCPLGFMRRLRSSRLHASEPPVLLGTAESLRAVSAMRYIRHIAVAATWILSSGVLKLAGRHKLVFPLPGKLVLALFSSKSGIP